VSLADVLEKELQRVGGHLGHVRLNRGRLLLLGLGLDDLDVEIFERLVELVDLRRVEVELVECENDLLLRHEAGLLALADERFGSVVVQRQASRSIPSPLFHVTPSSDRIDRPRFVNGLSVSNPALVWRDSCTCTGQFAMGQSDYLLDARSQCLQDGKAAI
jgi:hypothetical protein